MSNNNNNTNNNPPKEGAMKEYTFMGGNRQPVIVQYTEDGKVLKITVVHANPEWTREHIEPKLSWAPGKESVNYMTEEFIPFVAEEWELYMAIQGYATLYWMSDDGYANPVYPMNAPICKQCGIFPVFEYRGFNQAGVEFTQGWSKKCTGCDETRRNESGDDIATGDDVRVVHHQTFEGMTQAILGVLSEMIGTPDEDKDEDEDKKPRNIDAMNQAISAFGALGDVGTPDELHEDEDEEGK
jgi:hypothetical protein